ncbi:methyltransferase [Pseudocolwellia sp. AS88]|uniref:methyltransferase family protein n=1 Tax=Pseudocolwellia sp. AS88 TaxID=3063958 RepID=UPI0026F07D5F|nr:methyltransferase [Pseudocolwellia sp. AS88]MDO7083503.1 methyltransferase [Pseudocolwellia sp. AS88]
MDFIQSPSGIIEFARIYLAIFYTCVALFYTVKIIVTQKKQLVDLVHPGERFCSTWWNHLTFRFFRASILLICLSRVFFEGIDTYLVMLTPLQTFPVIFVGIVFMTVGFGMTVVIHLSMGNKWRSGIDNTGPKQLITDGYFRRSRNPIFVCVAFSQLGFFLALPSLFTLICLLIGVVMLHRQIIAEEQHLTNVFANEYKTYATDVRRWL